MAFEELRENIVEKALSARSRFEESSLYNSIQEKFYSLPKNTQKILFGLFLLLLIAILLSFPLMQLSSSQEHIASYENKMNLAQKAIVYGKSKNARKSEPKAYGMFEFRSQLNRISSGSAILPDQINVIEARGDSSFKPKSSEQNRYKVTAKQLNIKQAVSAAYGIKRLSDSVYLDSISIKARPDNDHYYDTEYTVSNFFVKPESELLPKPKVKKKKKKKR